MRVIDKHSMITESEHPEFCEIVQVGPRRGIFLAQKTPCQYLIHMEGEERSSIFPAGLVDRTYELDADYREAFTKDYEYNAVARKGGLRIGPRRIKRRRADLLLRKQQVENKELSKDKPPTATTAGLHKAVHCGEGCSKKKIDIDKALTIDADEDKKQKNIVIEDSDDRGDDRVACLHCGVSMKPRHGTLEPYYCKKCSKGTDWKRPFLHINVGDE